MFSIYMKTLGEAIFRRRKLNLGSSLYVFFWSLGSPCRDVNECPLPHGDLHTRLRDKRVKREIKEAVYIAVSRT